MARNRGRGVVKPASAAAVKGKTKATKTTALKTKKAKTSDKRGSQESPLVAPLGAAKRASNGKSKVTHVNKVETKDEFFQLPPCPGPKLQRFPLNNSKIKWLERLDEDRDEFLGIQGCVFHVEIESKPYALKIFKDYDVEAKRYYWEEYLGSRQDPRVVAYYMDPFFCECRAYGKIQEALADGALTSSPAVPCYGYIYLSEADEQLLESRGIYLGGNYSDSEDEHPPAQKQPLRALVKKLGSSKSGVTVRKQGKIYTGILQLNLLKIYNRDIRADNYSDGLLVDFGSSMTEPHILLDSFDKDEKEEVYFEDDVMFKTMLSDEHIKLNIDCAAIRSARDAKLGLKRGK